MNEILETLGLLADAVQTDALLMLANTVTWLDPLWEMSDEDVFEERDGVGLALSITRSTFPDIYARSIERIRAGASEKDLDSYICSEMSGGHAVACPYIQVTGVGARYILPWSLW